MLVQKEKLISLLEHKDSRVRDAAARSLDRFFAGSSGVTGHLITAIDRYPEDCLPHAAALKYFVPAEEDIPEIVRLYNSIDKSKKDDISLSLRFHLDQYLLHAPFELLEKNKNILCFNKDMVEVYDIAENWESFRNESLETLWGELNSLCKHTQENGVERGDRDYGTSLIDGLCRHGDEIREKVIMHLRQPKPSNYDFQEYMVILAGRLRLNETVPDLFRILRESDYMHTVHSECIRMLGKIGSREVVDEIERIYGEDPEEKIGLAEILRYIPHDYTENLTLRLLQEERNLNAKTFLACSLCDIYSWKAVEPLKDMVRKKQVDHEVTTITDDLVPVYAYHGRPIDGLHVISLTEQKQVEEHWEKNPLYQAAEPLRNAFLDYRSQENEKREKEEKQRLANKPKNILSMKKMRRKLKKKTKKKRK